VTVRPRWLVTCSCGWGRECVSAWAAKSVSNMDQRIGEREQSTLRGVAFNEFNDDFRLFIDHEMTAVSNDLDSHVCASMFL
jgi:hypothetical protein